MLKNSVFSEYIFIASDWQIKDLKKGVRNFPISLCNSFYDRFFAEIALEIRLFSLNAIIHMQISSLPFKLSKLNSNLSLTLGYLNPALNNSALDFEPLKHSIAHRNF